MNAQLLEALARIERQLNKELPRVGAGDRSPDYRAGAIDAYALALRQITAERNKEINNQLRKK